MENTLNGLGKYEYRPDIDTLYWEWNENTQKASWAEIQKALNEYAEAAEKCQAHNHIINEKKQFFNFVPEYQTWIDQNISTRTVKSGCLRFALIQSEDIFVTVAAEQIFEEENSLQIQFRAFKTYEEAEAWVTKLK